MQYLLYPVLIYGLLVTVSYGITFLQLRKLKLQYPSSQIKAVEHIPAYIQKLFAIPIQELQHFGFQQCCYLQVKPVLKIYPNIAWEILLYNQAHNSYAKVGIRHPIEPLNLFDIEFYTSFADKTFLVTTNGKGDTVIGKIPYFIMQDLYTAKTCLQWQFHQDRLRQLKVNKIPDILSPEIFIEALQVYQINYINSLIKLKHIFPISGRRLFRLNRKLAFKLTHKIIQENHKSASIIKQRREQAKNDVNLSVKIPVELELEGFRRMEQLQQGFIDSKLRPWLILGSFCLFVVTSTKYFESQSLIIFIAALMFHEGGHLLAMKLCGYRNPSLLFIPFLGAVSTACKDNATITQKFCVALAGPLPGLILGVLLAILFQDASYSSWVKQASWILICLNLFNLLPIYPLDGGQIADILIFSRFPYSDVLFKAFGAIIISLLGIIHPALFLLTIPLAFNIVYSYRAAKINNRLQKHLRKFSSQNPESILCYLFKYLQKFDYHKLPFNSRYVLIKKMLERYNGVYSQRTTKIFLSAVYCVSLLLGFLGSLQTVIIPLTSFSKTTNTSPDYVGIQQEIQGEAGNKSNSMVR